MIQGLTLFLAGGVALASALATGSAASSYQSLDKRATTPSLAQPSFSTDELYDLQTKFLDAFMAPKNAIEAKKINSTLLAPDVQGKIDVTRTFDGRELNTEYLFGLFANLADNPGSISLLGVPTSYEILNFVGNGNVASSQVRVMFNFTSLHLTLPVELGLWNQYNSDGQIQSYSATFKYWQWAVDTLISAATSVMASVIGNSNATPDKTIAFLTGAIAQDICTTATQSCKGKNAQYTDNNDCMNFLTKEIRFGDAYELGRNTLMCRSVHQNMVPFRPAVHCSHIGKTGGGMCEDDKTYTQTVNDGYFEDGTFMMQGLPAGAATAKGASLN